ncbi:MAG: AraC family transcriptional regulator [Acidobacteriaceae bacterium]
MALPPQTIYTESPNDRLNRPDHPLTTMDPLSEVLSLLKPQSYVSGGFHVDRDIAIQFPKHSGIKCYAVLAGNCWLVVDTIPDPIALTAGDCFLLPRGLPFRLTTDLALTPTPFDIVKATHSNSERAPDPSTGRFIAGGHFLLTGPHADMLLQSLPPIVHIRNESDKAAMRWSLERMRDELRTPQPGGSLIAQQLAYMMLIQALRLHLADTTSARTGWLSALADPSMCAAISAMHEAPGHPWTLQSLASRIGMSRSVFALRFKQIVGATPLEYLTRWRMLLAADRLQQATDSISTIARSLGYESESAFSKAFRRQMGCSPRQYAKPTNHTP